MEASCYDNDIKKGASLMISAQDLQTVQRILQELREYGQAHADEAWATFLNAKVEEALEKLPADDEEEYVSLSGKTLSQVYAEVKDEEAKMTAAELVERLRKPNPLLDDLMNEDD
jgi:hypothetical protein